MAHVPSCIANLVKGTAKRKYCKMKSWVSQIRPSLILKYILLIYLNIKFAQNDENGR